MAPSTTTTTAAARAPASTFHNNSHLDEGEDDLNRDDADRLLNDAGGAVLDGDLDVSLSFDVGTQHMTRGFLDSLSRDLDAIGDMAYDDIRERLGRLEEYIDRPHSADNLGLNDTDRHGDPQQYLDEAEGFDDALERNYSGFAPSRLRALAADHSAVVPTTRSHPQPTTNRTTTSNLMNGGGDFSLSFDELGNSTFRFITGVDENELEEEDNGVVYGGKDQLPHSLGFGASAFERLDSMIRKEEEEKMQRLGDDDGDDEKFQSDASARGRQHEKPPPDSVWDHQSEKAGQQDGAFDDGESASSAVRADAHYKSIMDESDLDEQSLPAMSAVGSPPPPSAATHQQYHLQHQQQDLVLNDDSQQPSTHDVNDHDIDASFSAWQDSLKDADSARDARYVRTFERDLDTVDGGFSIDGGASLMSPFRVAGTSYPREEVDFDLRSLDRGVRQQMQQQHQPSHTPPRDRGLRPATPPPLSSQIPISAPPPAQIPTPSQIPVPQSRPGALPAFRNSPGRISSPDIRLQKQHPQHQQYQATPHGQMDSGTWRPPSRSSIDFGDQLLDQQKQQQQQQSQQRPHSSPSRGIEQPFAQSVNSERSATRGRLPSPFANLGDDTPPSASSVDLRTEIRPRGQSRERGRDHDRGRDSENGLHEDVKNDNKATVDALRVLQDKVGLLESEKRAAKHKIAQLETELGRTRGIVLLEFEQGRERVTGHRGRSFGRRPSRTRSRSKSRASDLLEGARRGSEERRGGVRVGSIREEEEAERNVRDKVEQALREKEMREAEVGNNNAPQGAQMELQPDKADTTTHLVDTLRSRSEQLEQQLHATRAVAQTVERERDHVVQRLEETRKQVEQLRREVVMREIEAERERKQREREVVEQQQQQHHINTSGEIVRPSYTHVPPVAITDQGKVSESLYPATKTTATTSQGSPLTQSRQQQQSPGRTHSQQQQQQQQQRRSPRKETLNATSNNNNQVDASSFLHPDEIEQLRREIDDERAAAAGTTIPHKDTIRSVVAATKSGETHQIRKEEPPTQPAPTEQQPRLLPARAARKRGDVTINPTPKLCERKVAGDPLNPATKERLRKLVVTRLLEKGAARGGGETRNGKQQRDQDGFVVTKEGHQPIWKRVHNANPGPVSQLNTRPVHAALAAVTAANRVDRHRPTKASDSAKRNAKPQTGKKATTTPTAHTATASHEKKNGNGAPTTAGPPTKTTTTTTTTTVVGREMPFVVGQSTQRSHSVTANLQQVFSLLKAHNPTRCSVCRPRQGAGRLHQQQHHQQDNDPRSQKQSRKLTRPTVSGLRRRERRERGYENRDEEEEEEEQGDEEGDGDYDDHASFHGPVLDNAAAVAAAHVNLRKTRNAVRAKTMMPPTSGDWEQHHTGGLGHHHHQQQRGGGGGRGGRVGDDDDEGGDDDAGGIETLAAVLRVLEDEFGVLKRQYHTLVARYGAASHTTYNYHHNNNNMGMPHHHTTNDDLRALGDDLRAVIRGMDAKQDQIGILRDILVGFGVGHGAAATAAAATSRRRLPRNTSGSRARYVREGRGARPAEGGDGPR